MIPTINQSLLEANTKYIAHQCNCVTQNSAGIAKSIFDKFPWANEYRRRAFPSKLATIDIFGNEFLNMRNVINMYVQYYPGKPNRANFDSYENRLSYLKKCLNLISKIPDLESIGFPYGMGCRLAGGLQENYTEILEIFAEHVAKKNVKVLWYKYD
jgi:hypothetical protein